MLRPILRWAGSKRQQVAHLLRYFVGEYDRYVEPFAGSCCLFFALRPARALLADKNPALIETYQAICEWPTAIYDSLVAIPRTRRRYYIERERDPEPLCRKDRAIRFLFLNRNCFNGIYRTNANGDFNVPFGDSRSGRYPSRDEFLAAASALAGATLRCWDFGTTLRHSTPGDLVYLDPPYAVDERRVFREYGPRPFSSGDLDRLGVHLAKLNTRDVRFVLSYANCRAARRHFRDWRIRRICVRRHVAGFAGARRRAHELIVTNEMR